MVKFKLIIIDVLPFNSVVNGYDKALYELLSKSRESAPHTS